jgi:hypothetical protein
MKKAFLFARSWRILLAGVALFVLVGQAWAVDFKPFPTDFHPDGTPYHDSEVIMAAIANVPLDVGIVYDGDGNTDNIQVWNNHIQVYVGPLDVTATLDRIRLGDWMSAHPNDGGFFNLKDGELPNIPRMGDNYYMEFVVWFDMDLDAGTYDTKAHPFDPSVVYPGPMRMLLGRGGEVYFSGDHYGSDGLPAYYVYVPGC